MSFIGSRKSLLARPPLDVDVRKYADAVVVNGGRRPTYPWLKALSDYVKAEKSSGVWDLTDEVCQFRPQPGTANDMQVQGLVTLKRRTLMTAMGSAAIGPTGISFVGSLSQHIKTGWIQNTHAVAMGQSSMWVGADIPGENSNAGYVVGANINTNSSLSLRPRTSSLYAGTLNSQSATLAGAASAIGFTSYNRSGSTFTFRRDGSDVGAVVPGTSGTTGLNIELYVGALNTAGTAGTFYTGPVNWVGWGASHTTAQDASHATNLDRLYARLDLLIGSIPVYLSSVTYGGIDTGVDSNPGIYELPKLTWDGAFNTARSGDFIIMNGNPAAPTTYVATTHFSINKSLTFRSAFPLGATLASSGVTAAVRTSPASGQTITADSMLFDGSSQTSGPAQNLLYLTTTAVKYAVNALSCKFQTWDDYFAIYAPSSDIKVDLVVRDTIFTNSAARGAISCTSVAAGSLLVDGGGTTITNSLNASTPGISWAASADGVSATVRDHAMAISYDATIAGSGYSAILIKNCANVVVDGNYDGTGARTVALDGSAAPTTNAHVIAVSTDVGGTERVIDDSVIRNWIVTSNAYGGSFFRMGNDGADRTKANRCGIEYCTGTGTANFAAGGGHCIFLVWVVDGWIRYSTASVGSLGTVNKDTVRGEVAYNTVSDQTSALSLHKGAEDFFDHHNTYTAVAGNNGTTIVRIHADDVTLVPSDGAFEDNIITVNAATGVILVDCQNDGSTATFARNVYNTTNGGTLHATPFRMAGVSYTPAQWKASIEPTATGNIF